MKAKQIFDFENEIANLEVQLKMEMIARKDCEDRCERLEALRYFAEDSYEAVLQTEFDTMRKQFELKVAHMQSNMNNDRK